LEKALEGARLAQVVVTHGHGDHASGAPAIEARFGGAQFLKRPWSERDSKWAVSWSPIDDGDVIEAGDTSLAVVHTPGHAPDHLCLWHADTRVLFCGDLAIEGGTVWIPPRLQGDMAAYLWSLERILAMRPARMYPAHGGVIEEPERLLRTYLRHRQDREEQVVRALRRGHSTPATIAARIYAGLNDAAIAMGVETVTAHLMKLQIEGRATVDEDGWHMIDR
jgi:glyoxylase-like metal-dependent hydrolase (beta-lactamase superfamily II)